MGGRSFLVGGVGQRDQGADAELPGPAGRPEIGPRRVLGAGDDAVDEGHARKRANDHGEHAAVTDRKRADPSSATSSGADPSSAAFSRTAGIGDPGGADRERSD